MGSLKGHFPHGPRRSITGAFPPFDGPSRLAASKTPFAAPRTAFSGTRRSIRASLSSGSMPGHAGPSPTTFGRPIFAAALPTVPPSALVRRATALLLGPSSSRAISLHESPERRSSPALSTTALPHVMRTPNRTLTVQLLSAALFSA